MADIPGSPSSPKIQFKEPNFESTTNRRLSSNRSTRSEAIGSDSDEEHAQDWTIVTNDKDSWANRERRRSSVFRHHDAYPATVKAINSSSPPKERQGSILSLWSHGKDKEGNDVLHSGEPAHKWDNGEIEDGEEVNVERTASKSKAMDRRGSILSVFEKGKDENGRDIILSG